MKAKLTNLQRFQKRTFDIVFSALGLVVVWPLVVLCALVASIETKSFGIFKQVRVGLDGRTFIVYKIKTMFSPKAKEGRSAITAISSDMITKSGAFFRKYKLDELPQLFNVLTGDMSFVGPRPDVPGYADRLKGKDRVMLTIRPGITGPASIKYKNEEELLKGQSDPKSFNDKVIWPDKVNINIQYIENYSFLKDLKYIARTIKG